MTKQRHQFLPALGALMVLSGSLLVAGVRQQPATCPRGAEPAVAARGPAPSLARPTSPTKAPDTAGLLQRCLLLEPIKVSGQLTDSAVRATVKTEYFPNQFAVLPHDGETVTAKRVTLKKGPNVIRAAIINAGGATDFCARFLDDEGHSVKGLALSVAASGQAP